MRWRRRARRHHRAELFLCSHACTGHIVVRRQRRHGAGRDVVKHLLQGMEWPSGRVGAGTALPEAVAAGEDKLVAPADEEPTTSVVGDTVIMEQDTIGGKSVSVSDVAGLLPAEEDGQAAAGKSGAAS